MISDTEWSGLECNGLSKEVRVKRQSGRTLGPSLKTVKKNRRLGGFFGYV